MASGRVYESLGPRPRRTYLDSSVENRLSVPATVIAAYASTAEFREALAKGGVKQKQIDTLGALLAPAVAEDDAQAAAGRANGVASAVLDEAMEAAEAAFAEISKRGTAAGRRDPEVRAALKVGRREKGRVKRLAQMRQYLNAADSRQAVLEGYGAEPVHFVAARATLAAAEAAATAWVTADKVAEDATKKRDKMMVPLDEEMRDVQERGRAGASDRPDFLELLGLPPG